MLEKPDLPDDLILARVQSEYGLRAGQLDFLPLGADVNTAVYRLAAQDGAVYFLKLRKGRFANGSYAEISVSLPRLLATRGLRAVIAPLETRARGLWASLDDYKLMLYPFVEGRDGYQAALDDAQWTHFGAALRVIHATPLPPELSGCLPRETYSSYWREQVNQFQAQVEQAGYADPVAAKTAALLRDQHTQISLLVTRTEQLAQALQAQPLPLVLCHGDMHAGNLLLSPDGALYIVDWDNPTLAPKERDLALVGGCPAWNNPRGEARFYQGYGPAEVNPAALSYYRYERILQDIAAFCTELLLSDAGGRDREQSYQYLSSSFLPGRDLDIALMKDL